MKKLCCLLVSTFCLCATGFSQTAVSTMTASKAFIDPKIYNNERAKTMCEEWPGCPQWAEDRKAQDPFFLILDAEIERWLDHWEGDKAIWLTRLYVEVRETAGYDAYKFAAIRNRKDYTPKDPIGINYFPGHPIEGRPSEHAYYQTYITNVSLSKCKEWPECDALLKKPRALVGKAVDSQYIYDFDENGEALWARSLYVKFFYFFDTTKSFVFRAKQKRAYGPYVPQPVKQIAQCPNEPEFHFLK